MNTLLLIAMISTATAMLLVTMTNYVNQSFSLQVLAQSTNATNTTSIATSNITSLTFPGQTIVHRGIIASEEPTHLTLPAGEKPHAVGILPLRKDGATYTGILTFTATKPVEIGFGHRLHIDNSTLSQIETDKLGELFIAHHIDKGKYAVPGVISVGSVIVPDYGSSPPYFSASVPFVGSSVWLRTPHGDQFVAVYEVAAEIVQPQAVVDLEGANVNGTEMSIP